MYYITIAKHYSAEFTFLTSFSVAGLLLKPLLLAEGGGEGVVSIVSSSSSVWNDEFDFSGLVDCDMPGKTNVLYPPSCRVLP